MQKIITPNSITVVLKGVPYTVVQGNPRFEQLKQLFKGGNQPTVEEVEKLANPDNFTEKVVAEFGDVQVFRGHVTYKGLEISGAIVDRILQFNEENLPIEPICRLLANLQVNPSFRAVHEFFGWLEHNRMPITDDGCFLAYKIVGSDYKDLYSGKFNNTPGRRVEVPRNQVDEDSSVHCSYGLHACGIDYLPGYGGFYGQGRDTKIILVKVNPADVVAFPKDYASKFRCSGYDVLQELSTEEEIRLFPGRAAWGVEPQADEVEQLDDDPYFADYEPEEHVF